MSHSSLSQLSPDAARRRLEVVDLEEKSKLAEGLALLALVDQRRDFLEAGYSSMYAYCTGKLGWSNDRTLKRLQAARLAQRVPLLLVFIGDGRVTVTNACELATVLTLTNAPELLVAAAFKSKLEVRRLALEHSKPFPRPEPNSELADTHAPAHVDSSKEPAAEPIPPIGATGSPAPAQADRPARRGRATPQLDGSFDVRLTLTAEEYALLVQAQDLLAHVVRDGDPAVVVAKALAQYVAHLNKKRFGAGAGSAVAKHAPRGRHVPLAMRRHVAERDGHCCSFVGADGHRCGESRGLQFDHIIPVALGGMTRAENLRMLCAAHNRFEADRLLGAEQVAAIRERRETASALAEAAKRREEQRKEECEQEPAPPTPEQDTVAALIALGFRASDARDAARRTESANDEPLGERVKRAIQFLSGPILQRSARHARPTS